MRKRRSPFTLAAAHTNLIAFEIAALDAPQPVIQKSDRI
jgi:hypothetical protein